MGRAGAFTARADDASAIEYNPAGLASIDGTYIYLTNRFGYADEEYRRAGTLDWSRAQGGLPDYVTFDPVSNQEAWQLLGPMVVAASDFGLDDWGFAIGAYGPPGIATQKFPVDGGSRYMLTERDVKILYYNLSAAWKYKKIFGIGMSLQWVDMSSLKLGLVINGSTAPGDVSPVKSLFDMQAIVEGADHYGFSGILGAWYRPRPFLQMGFSGRLIPVDMNADCDLSLEPLDLNLETPPELKRNSKSDNDVTFSMTMPVELRFGIRYMYLDAAKEVFDLEFDFRYEMWSLMDEFVINGEGLSAEVFGTEVEVGKIVIPKKWRDTYSLRLGSDVTVVEDVFFLRAGGFFESAAARRDYAYVDFFASDRLGASAGASVTFYGLDLSLAYTYVFELPFTVSEEDSKIYQQVPGSSCDAPYTDSNTCDEHYAGQPSAAANAGTYIASYHFMAMSVSYGF